MTEISGQRSGVSEKTGAKRMSKKIMLIALCSMLIAVVLPVEAQQPGKVPRIGFLSVATPVSGGQYMVTDIDLEKAGTG
jgi:hypothetical protein